MRAYPRSMRPILLGTTALAAMTAGPAQALDNTWTGANSNQWGDEFSWSEGTVPTASDIAIIPGPAFNSQIDLGGFARPIGGLRLLNDSGAVTWFRNGSVVLAGTDSVIVGPALGQGAYPRFVSGAILTLDGRNPFDIAAGADAGLRIEGEVTGSGTLVKQGVGRLDVAGQVLSAGGLSIENGTVRLERSDAIGMGVPVAMAGGTLDMGGHDQRIGALLGSSGTILGNGASGTAPTLTVGAAANATFGASLKDGTGRLGLTKQGSGTLILTGADNTYSGPTDVQAGTLEASAGGTLSDLSDITVFSGATLRVAAGDQEIGSLSGAGTVRIEAGTSLVTGLNERATTFAGSFSGGGELVVDGVATRMTLTGNSAFGGDLTVCCALLDIQGTFSTPGTASVRGGRMSVSGPGGRLTADTLAVEGGTVAVTGGGRIDAAFLGAIVGTVDVSGSGSTLTAAALSMMSLAGDVTLNVTDGGRVAVAGDATLASLVLGSTTATVRGADSRLSVAGRLAVGSTNGGVTTPGLLTVEDGGRVTAGTLAIGEEGTVRVGTGGTGGTIDALSVANDGTLAFDHTGRLVFESPLSGAGATTKNGSGTLVLAGPNTSTGSLSIVGGTLVGTSASLGRGAIANNARLVIDQARDATFETPISGAGTLAKEGAGRLDLRGLHAFTGATVVGAGELSVNGSLAGSGVTVSDGARLSGTGTVGGLAARAGATIAPGNSIGTLNVAGDVAFDPGSSYVVEVDSQGRSDRIAAQGGAALSGGLVHLRPDQGSYASSRAYRILTAERGRTGRFALAPADFAFLAPSLAYDENGVVLQLRRKVAPPIPPVPLAPPAPVAFSSAAISRNQYATATAVEALGEGNRIYDAVLGASTSGARAAFDALSGEVHASAASVAYRDIGLAGDAIAERLARSPSARRPALPAAYAADRPVSGAQTPPATATRFDRPGFAFWGEGLGSWGRTGSDGNAAALDRAAGGFLLGAHMAATPAARLGIAGGFVRSTFDIDARGSSGTVESVFGSLYGSAEWGSLALRLGGLVAGHDVDTNRSAIFPSFADRAATSYGGSTFQAFGELAYGMSGHGLLLEPFMGASILRLHTSGFREDGGVSALTGYGRTQDLGTTTLGLRAEAVLDEEAGLVLRGAIGWRRAYGDLTPSAQLAFDPGAASFTVAGAPVDRNALVAQAGLDWQAGQNVSLGIAYRGQFGGNGQDQTLNGHFLWRF